ncbi:hypothetical protein [Larkinella soli]|nr:hypothetical protein [Larkinella soli]
MKDSNRRTDYTNRYPGDEDPNTGEYKDPWWFWPLCLFWTAVLIYACCA